MKESAIQKRKELRQKLVDIYARMRYVRSKWLFILICVILGVGFAFFVDSILEKKYVAEVSFVLQESGEASASSGFAAQFGLGNIESKGLFQNSDNIIWLYTSTAMIKETLLTEVKKNGKSQRLINWYIDIDEDLKDKILNNPKLKKTRFDDVSMLSREQNSILGMCIGKLRNNCMEVIPASKTINIIRVITTTTDELFSKEYTEELVSIVNNFYIRTKSQKAKADLDAIQKKVDEIKRSMSKSMSSVATSAENNPYPNPLLQQMRVEGQKQSVDAQLNTNLYLQLMASLESSKINLAKETPLIQIIDNPVLPLPSKNIKLPVLIAVCGLLFGFLAVAYFLTKFYLRSIMTAE